MTKLSEIDSSIEKPITGRHVLFAMIAFFGVIIAVNLTMATFARTSWTGLEVKNSYVASQDYNAKLALAARQKALGWSSGLVMVDGQFRFELINAAGSRIVGATIDAVLKRPVQERDDLPLVFREFADGDYRADVPAEAGIWDVDLSVQVPARQTYRQIFRIQLKD